MGKPVAEGKQAPANGTKLASYTTLAPIFLKRNPKAAAELALRGTVGIPAVGSASAAYSARL